MAWYISMNSELSPKNVWPQVEKKGGDACPWVRIGNLYTSVTFTGSESWLPAVKDLYNKGQRKFAVLTGRHGDQFGQRIDSRTHLFEPRNPSLAADSAIDPKEDLKVANSLIANGRFSGINIVVVDVGSGAHNTVELLRATIKRYLEDETVVILAWCYSLYAMKPGWYAPLANAWPQSFAGSDMVPISWTARDWSWVLQYRTTDASNAAGLEAVH
jgi:hypothetical protein